MKKLIAILILAIAALPALAQESATPQNPESAQESAPALKKENYGQRGDDTSSGLFDRWGTRAGSWGKSDPVTIDMDYAIGYAFNNRWSISMPFTATVGLFEKDEVRSYQWVGQIGLEVGLKLLKDELWNIELAPRVGTTVCSDDDWEFVSYGLECRTGNSNSITFGLGVRYLDSYNSHYSDCWNFYGSIGFRLFFKR